MFDFLLGLFAIGNAAIEAATVMTAINSGNNSQTSCVVPEKPCFEEEQLKEKKPVYDAGHYISAVEAKNEYNRRLQQKKMREAKEQEKENQLEVNDFTNKIYPSTKQFTDECNLNNNIHDSNVYDGNESYVSANEYDYDECDDTSAAYDDFGYEEERKQREEEDDWYDEQERLREEEAERIYQERLEEIKDRYPSYNIDLVPDGADLDDVERDARLDDYLMNW